MSKVFFWSAIFLAFSVGMWLGYFNGKRAARKEMSPYSVWYNTTKTHTVTNYKEYSDTSGYMWGGGYMITPDGDTLMSILPHGDSILEWKEDGGTWIFEPIDSFKKRFTK